jgi:hypothetical protein
LKPTGDAVRFLSEAMVERVVDLIRRDAALGRGSCSSWEAVTPSDYEAGERVRKLIEEGFVPINGEATPLAILNALRRHEPSFFGLN